jgi:hypothetical protein
MLTCQYLCTMQYFTVTAAFCSNGILLALYIPWSLVVPFSHLLPSLAWVSCSLPAFIPYCLFFTVPASFNQCSAYHMFCLANYAQQSPWCNHLLVPSIYTYFQCTYCRSPLLLDLLLDPFPAPQHRSHAPTPRSSFILHHSPYTFARPWKQTWKF